MSNKVGEARGMVPKLRFPEFRDPWLSPAMSEVYRFRGNNSFSRDQLNYEDGEVKTVHYGDIHTKFASRFIADAERVPFVNRDENHPSLKPANFCSAGDMIFADASEDMNDIGKAIEVVDAGSFPLCAGMHTILASPQIRKMAVGFGCYLFASPNVRRQIQRESQGAKVLGISPTRLGSIRLPLPKDLREQQKIADCLSSLDAVIAAEGDRLAALKDHKKGLMQQLFPAPGQTTPHRRFPEFQGKGEWVNKPLSDCIKLVSGLHLSPEEYAEAGEAPYFSGPSDFTDEVSSTSKWTNKLSNVALEGDILLVVKGSGVGDFWRLELPRVAIGRQLMAIRMKSGGQDFLHQSLLTKADWLKSRATGNLIPGLARPDILELPLPFPPTEAEQQKIADCLRSIDVDLTNGIRKLEVLKTHKSALMQQLFPSPHEAPEVSDA